MPKPVIYEKHPITPERKAELVAAGYKIIDAKFAPADYAHPDAEKKAPAKRTTKKAPAKAADDKAEG